jgi:hypothetical protein
MGQKKRGNNCYFLKPTSIPYYLKLHTSKPAKKKRKKRKEKRRRSGCTGTLVSGTSYRLL